MSIVHDFERAFNRQDVKALLDCFAEDASYHDNFYGAHSGQVGLRAMFERMFHEGRDYAWKMDVIVGAPTRAAAEWTFSYVVTDVIPRSADRKIGFRGMSLFELRNGKIQAYREYWDTGVAL